MFSPLKQNNYQNSTSTPENCFPHDSFWLDFFFLFVLCFLPEHVPFLDIFHHWATIALTERRLQDRMRKVKLHLQIKFVSEIL